ncbi:MAG: hypothetical protein IT204_18255 [Fimbriimonadaceae bacterium]|nr:hypothetical protein [Fimbriimonadaceae bacterium]
MRLLVGTLLALLAPAATPPTADDLAALRAEVRAAAYLPEGAWEFVLGWEAEDAKDHAAGQRAAAPGASGDVWEAQVGRDEAGKAILYGPYVELPAGHYLALFRLRNLDADADGSIVTIDAASDFGKTVLARRDLRRTELPPATWVVAPLPFAHSGPKLECRVSWHGESTVQLDWVRLFRLPAGTNLPQAKGPQPASTGQPRDLLPVVEPRPYPSLLPKAPAPARDVLTVDLRRLPGDQRLLLLTLQGLVNRRQPRIYTLGGPQDEQWLAWMQQRGWIDSSTPVADPLSLLTRFQEVYQGVVVPDPDLFSTKHLATMLAATDDLLVASPRLAQRLRLPLKHDLRGRFKRHHEVWQYAFDTLWPRLNHHCLAVLWPDAPDVLRDYLVQHRIFTFWLGGRIDGIEPGGDAQADLATIEGLLAQMPTNIPCLGYPWNGVDVGIGEHGGVQALARYGKFLVGSSGSTNLSFHSGFPTARLTQQQVAPPALDPGKVYLTWLISDGDNLPVLTHGNFPQLWASPARGQLPLTWTISPAAAEVLPAVCDWYYRHAGPGDSFVTAVSGVGYTYPEDYAERYQPAQRQRLFDGFLELTGQTMQALDLRSVWMMGIQDPAMIRRYSELIPNCEALFPDYGRRVTQAEDAFYPAANGVPTFHAVTGWREGDSREEAIQRFVDELRRFTPARRPAFLHAFVWNWGADLSLYPEVMRRLGPDYVALRHDQLAALARQQLTAGGCFVQAPPRLVTVEGTATAVTVVLHGTAPTSRQVTVAATAGLGEVAPQSVELAAGGRREVTLAGRSDGQPVHLTVTAAAEQRLTVPVQRIAGSELTQPLTGVSRLRCVDVLHAASLPHRDGAEATVAGSWAPRVWTASSGQHQGGFIVFGPYRPTAAGRYLALFRVRRDAAAGERALLLDAHAAGSPGRLLAEHAVLAAELPAEQWRWVALPFEHPGGNLETRVQWSGRGTVQIDAIAIFAPD